MTTKQEVKRAYEKCHKYAVKHTDAIRDFCMLCQDYYGYQFGDVPALQDNDNIIETIDYGGTHFAFEKFHELMLNNQPDEEQ